MSVSLIVENAARQFGSFAALRGVSLTIEPGELVALLGPSGSGKTTLLRLIAGLDHADDGRILFDGLDSSTLTLRERRIGFVFQNYALFRHMTVADNIAFGLKARPRRERPAPAEIDRRVADLLELVQLGALGRRYPSQLSGGQRQRVALARALAIEPRVLLLDEPFGALDAQVRKDLRRWLRDLHDRTGHTTLFVTHDQDEALELADRVAILNEGRIEQVGTPDDVHDRPATAFVCSFLGESSRLPVDLAGGQAFFGDLPVLKVPHINAAGRAEIYVRPHEVKLAEPGAGHIEGVVTRLRRHGGHRRAEVALAGSTQLLETEIRGSVAPAVGERVGLRIVHARAFAAA